MIWFIWTVLFKPFKRSCMGILVIIPWINLKQVSTNRSIECTRGFFFFNIKELVIKHESLEWRVFQEDNLSINETLIRCCTYGKCGYFMTKVSVWMSTRLGQRCNDTRGRHWLLWNQLMWPLVSPNLKVGEHLG